MSVTSYNEMEGSRKATQTADAITATRLYKVITNSMATSEYDVLTYTDTPSVGDVYGANALMRVQSVDATQVTGEPLHWTVTVVFSTSVPEDKDEVDPDPTRRPPEVSINQIKSTEPVLTVPDYFDISADVDIVLQNSAGVSYDPPIEREITDMAISVVQNYADFHPNDILGYRGAVNSATWEGFAPGLCRIVNVGYDRATENGITFWKRSIEIHVREQPDNYAWNSPVGTYIYPWQVIRVNEGTQQLNAASGTSYILCTTADGGPVSEPVGLDVDGLQLSFGSDPSLLRWNVYPKKDFAGLDIRLT